MNYEAILLISLLSTILSTILSFHLINQHVNNWSSPIQQRNIIKIILMAPLFAIDSFIGLLELDKGETVAHVIDMVKECYEAVVINAFLLLMYDICGLNVSTKQKQQQQQQQLPEGVKGRELHIPFPLGLLFEKHPHFDVKWLHRLRTWTVQFIICRPLLSAMDLIFVDLYPNAAWSRVVKIVIGVSLNISVTTAIMALITFYHAFENELAKSRPLAKFACIKGVVFFATWQGVVLKALKYFDVLHEGYRFSVDEIELAWQDLLVCVEMGVIFSPLHGYAFPISEYKKKEVEMTKKKTN